MRDKLVITTVISLTILILSCAPRMKLQDKSPSEIYKSLKPLFEKGKYKNVIKLLEDKIYSFRGSEYYDDAEMLLAKSYFRNGEYHLAVTEFKKIVRNFPRSKYLEEAKFMICRSYYKLSPRPDLDQNYTREAINQAKSFISNYPNSEYKKRAKDVLKKCYDKLAEKKYNNAKLYYKIHKYEAAKIYAKDLIQEYENSSWVPKSLLLLGKAYRKLGNGQKAKQALSRLTSDYSAHKAAKKAKKLLEQIDV